MADLREKIKAEVENIDNVFDDFNKEIFRIIKE